MYFIPVLIFTTMIWSVCSFGIILLLRKWILFEGKLFVYYDLSIFCLACTTCTHLIFSKNLRCMNLHLVAVSRRHRLFPLLNLSKWNDPDQVNCSTSIPSPAKFFVFLIFCAKCKTFFCFDPSRNFFSGRLIVPRLDPGSQNIKYDPVSDNNHCSSKFPPLS